MLNKNPSLQVIHFVLQTDGQQAVGLYRLGLSVQVQKAHDNVFGSLDLVVDTRHRETAFLADLRPIAFDQLRIDQNQQLIARF